jgi:MFS family permease
VYSISLGYGAGLFSPTLFAASADIFPGRNYGAVAGLLLAGMGAGGAVGPWIGGYLFDLSGSYTSSFILSMVSMGLSCISLWLAAPRKTAMS